MLPDIWGKHAWNFLHLVTLSYPINPSPADKQNYYNFFTNLQYVLPCEKCRNNMTKHLKKYPLTDKALSSRNELVKWCIDLHNIVNYYTGKPMLTYKEAMTEINKLAHPNKSSFTDKVYYLLIIIVLITICYLIYYYFIKAKN